ncbi:MAG: sulfatase-like hydrolase/transferase [Candidatus Hydrogenedentes bacterium]|nr:sulfatase-like hydrolase/transferase [Candidatus Hydrogenedentota bacterium]
MDSILSKYKKRAGSKFRRWAKAVFCGCLCTGAFLHAPGVEAAPSTDTRPNIIFLLSDDQRPDTIAALGNPVIETPNLDALVAEGVRFSRAVCATPLCVPSRAEILTGVGGFRNGFRAGRRAIDPALATWAGTLRGAGYHTWYVGKWHNDGMPTTRGYEESLGLFHSGGAKWWKPQVDGNGQPVTGYKGWIFQSDDGEKYPELGVGLTPNISAKFADAAITFIERDHDKPYFLHVNFTAPHDPLLVPPGYEDKYDPDAIPLPKNFAPVHPFDHGNLDGRDEQVLPAPRTEAMVRKDIALYYAVVSHLDAQVGRILEALERSGEKDNTILIYTSDHGLAMGSHGLRGKQNMYEHTVNVPLIIRGPGIPQGRQSDAQCYLRDLFPTTCDLVGMDIPPTVEGKSLQPLWTGESESIYDAVFCHYGDVQRMIRTDRWKLIYYPHLDRTQLFDLKNDPEERNDLSKFAAHEATVAELRGRLAAWQKAVGAPVRDSIP